MTRGVNAGVAVPALLLKTAFIGRRKRIKSPTPEKMASGTKAKYRLHHRYVYLVEESKPEFSFKVFTDSLKGRCVDCEDDESFECESLDCGTCGLPCPCKQCSKYKSRPQGLVVTRRFPNDVRGKHFLQTTPIIWLSTVPGKESMDPAKLNMLTDLLTAFMEKSQNGIVLVDGIEYLSTTNDFQRVLRAVDRWTDATMTSDTKLMITVDPRSFERRELALLERNREVIRPDAKEPWKVIPEPV